MRCEGFDLWESAMSIGSWRGGSGDVGEEAEGLQGCHTRLTIQEFRPEHVRSREQTSEPGLIG